MELQIYRPSAFRRVPADSLPVFAAVDKNRTTLYTPRLACVLDKGIAPAVMDYIEQFAAASPTGNVSCASFPSMAMQAALRIVRAARVAEDEMIEAAQQKFEPECLTLYVNNYCNMHCHYCYSRPGASRENRVSADAVRAASRLVARACAKRNNPDFALAIHGGGEPTLEKEHVTRLLGIVTEEAGQYGLRLRSYIATNGAVSEETAHWLATRFDLVGVSCDGPPSIQDSHRPGRNGQPLSKNVARTMSILRRHSRPFHIRSTITGATVGRQAEIVAYLADYHAPTEIRMEPVYSNPSAERPLGVSQVATFVDGFFSAQAAGETRGISVTTSITRPGAVYGPYCNVLRRVLNLVPGDIATGCFLDSRPEEIAHRGAQVGTFDVANGAFLLDTECIDTMIDRCSRQPDGCKDCLCSHQCTRGCPDLCALDTKESVHPHKTFRCQANRMLLARTIHESITEAWNQTPDGECRTVHHPRRMLDVAVYKSEEAP